MTPSTQAYFTGGGIGYLAGAAFLSSDGDMVGAKITILETGAPMGGSLDGAGDAALGYSMRGHADHRQLRMHLGPVQVHPFAGSFEPQRG